MVGRRPASCEHAEDAEQWALNDCRLRQDYDDLAETASQSTRPYPSYAGAAHTALTAPIAPTRVLETKARSNCKTVRIMGGISAAYCYYYYNLNPASYLPQRSEAKRRAKMFYSEGVFGGLYPLQSISAQSSYTAPFTRRRRFILNQHPKIHAEQQGNHSSTPPPPSTTSPLWNIRLMHIPHMLHHLILPPKPRLTHPMTPSPLTIHQRTRVATMHSAVVPFEICFARAGVGADQAVVFYWWLGTGLRWLGVGWARGGWGG